MFNIDLIYSRVTEFNPSQNNDHYALKTEQRIIISISRLDWPCYFQTIFIQFIKASGGNIV